LFIFIKFLLGIIIFYNYIYIYNKNKLSCHDKQIIGDLSKKEIRNQIIIPYSKHTKTRKTKRRRGKLYFNNKTLKKK